MKSQKSWESSLESFMIVSDQAESLKIEVFQNPS